MTGLFAMPPARQVPLPDGGWLSVHEQAGQGPALLLLHGFTDCAESYRLLLPHLAGRHLVIPDLRGHGASFRGPIRSLDTFAQDVEVLVVALGLDEPVVVGHSMGALVAVAIAARKRVKLSGMVLISGSLLPASPALSELKNEFAALPVPLPAMHPFLDVWYACSRPVPSPFLERLRASCTAMRREDWLVCLDVIGAADLTEAAASLTVPTVVLGGSDDSIFPEEHQTCMTATLRAIRSLVFAGVGHNPHWEVPAEVAVNILQATHTQ